MTFISLGFPLLECLLQVLNKKGKSAHDVLTDDAKLSKQVAVTADEMADYDPVCSPTIFAQYFVISVSRRVSVFQSE